MTSSTQPARPDPVARYLDRMTKSSRKAQAYAINTLGEMVAELRTSGTGWHNIDQETADRVREEIDDRFKPNTAKRYLSAFRGVLAAAADLGMIDEDQAARLGGKRSDDDDQQSAADVVHLPQPRVMTASRQCEYCAYWNGNDGLGDCARHFRTADGRRYRLVTMATDGGGCREFAPANQQQAAAVGA